MLRSFFLLLGTAFFLDRGSALSWSDKNALFQDCEIFNKSHVYGGPVCGSDGKTYSNSMFLDCLNYRDFKDVATVHSGGCWEAEEYCKTNLYYEPVCGTDGRTYTNLESLLCVNYRRSRDVSVKSKGPCEEIDHCYRDGTRMYGMNPVCGSNGFTYQNAAQVKCLQRYNKALEILHDGGCSVRHVYALYAFDGKTCEISKTRYEWNPVCASDGSVYPNPFVFLCHQPRADLKVVTNGECGSGYNEESCRFLDFLAGSPRNSTFDTNDEVCGSDGSTYDSLHHLQCHTRANKYVFPRHSGRCSGPDDDPCGSIPDEDHRLPVCGSDGSTYVSPEALWCAGLRSPEKKVTFVHDGPC